MEDINFIKLDDQQLNAIIFMVNEKKDKDIYEQHLLDRFLRIKEIRVEHHSALADELATTIKLREA